MQQFELRRDRFNSFSTFENPTLNIGMQLALPDFRPYCKERQIPPFHFFLFSLLTSIRGIDNFMYRILDGDVIKITEFFASYTVINKDNNYNFASFTMSDDLAEFVTRSVEAGRIAHASSKLINCGENWTPRESKNNFFTTCMPWIEMTSIAHPIFRFKESDVPMIAWGKFSAPSGGSLTLPFSVQAHHGFVDGYHIHLLGETIAAKIRELMS